MPDPGWDSAEEEDGIQTFSLQFSLLGSSGKGV